MRTARTGVLGLAVGLVLAVTGARAEPRLASPGLTCAGVSAAVAEAGAAIVERGPALYDRVVRDIGFCPTDQTTKPAYAPTADVAQCFVGYRCVDRFSEQRELD